MSGRTAPAPAEVSAPGDFRFTSADIERWALFSGDRNPIHFDVEQARRIGAAGRVVHGMLALLAFKQAAHAAAAPSDGWQRFRALFRSPVLEDATVSIRIAPSREGLRFKGIGPEGEECIRGSFAPGPEPDGDSVTGRSAARRLDPCELGRFREMFAAAREPWMGLDAMLFGDFIRNRVQDVAASVRPQAEHLVGPLGAEPLIVHGSHTVLFDARACARLDESISGGLPILYRVSNPLVLGGAGQVAVTVSLPVTVERRRIMEVTMGLVLRKSGEERGEMPRNSVNHAL